MVNRAACIAIQEACTALNTGQHTHRKRHGVKQNHTFHEATVEELRRRLGGRRIATSITQQSYSKPTMATTVAKIAKAAKKNTENQAEARK